MANTQKDNSYGVTESVTAPVRTRRDVQSHADDGRASGTAQRNRPTRSELARRPRDAPITSPIDSRRLTPLLSSEVPLADTMRRKKWTTEENCDVSKAYFRATQCGAHRHGFRKRMYQEWLRIRPDSNRTENQIAVQYYAINNNKLLSDITLKNIEEEVKKEIATNQRIQQALNQTTETDETFTEQTENNMNQTQHTADTEEIVESQERNQEQPKTTETYTEPDQGTLTLKFQENLVRYSNTDPVSRPKLKKIKPNYTTFAAIKTVNNFIEKKIKTVDSIEEVHMIVYSAAKTILDETTPHIKMNENTNQTLKEPKWKARIERKINKIRSKLTKINEWKRGKANRRTKKEVKIILKEMNIKQDDREYERKLSEGVEKLKQIIAMLGKRLRKYNKSNKRRNQNKTFTMNEKRVYQMFSDSSIGTKNSALPDIKDMYEYWSKLWQKSKTHPAKTKWLVSEENRFHQIPPMATVNLQLNDIKETVKKLHNWKTPGPDNIHNFWWKHLESIHPFLCSEINRILNNPETTPKFLLKGTTYMKPKNDNTKDPKMYRPITCLNTLYKIITSLVTRHINYYIENNKILTDEQKGCRTKTQGCKEQLIIDGIIAENAKNKKRNIAVAWLDYQKAFDSVPHSYLITILKTYKIDPKIVKFLETCMQFWKTELVVTLNGKTLRTEPIPIQCGIFQGDSLSPLWFILSLNPLSNLLSDTKIGYQLEKHGKFINHLLYVDDAKLYAPNEAKLNELINITENFSKDIGMTFGYNKCAKVIINKGKTVKSSETDNIKIKQLEDTEKYKYLGFDQYLTKNTKEIRTETEEKLMRRVNKILSSELNGRNMIKAINTWAIPVITYSFGVINWSNTEIERINRRIRTSMTKHRIHHTNASTTRLYLPRKLGGRGLLNLQYLHDKQILNLKKYFHQTQSDLIKAICKIDEYSPLKLTTLQSNIIIPKIKDLYDTWTSKTLHGKYPYALEKGDKEESVNWLIKSGLYAETEGFITAIQDGVIKTKNYQKYILKENIIDDNCRLCHSASETIEHITSGCEVIANTEYLTRHNLTSGIVHQELAKRCKFQKEAVPYYKYIPTTVLENENYRIYWDIPIITDRPIPNNRPDITFVDKTRSEAFLIDITHPNDHNLQKAESTKLTKYYDLAEEYKAIHKLNRVTVVPIVISCNGIVGKNLKTNLKKIGVNNKIITLMQKSVIMETCRITRKYLNIKE